MSGNIRFREDDCQTLRRLKVNPEVQEIAVSQDIIDDPSESITWEEIFKLIIPDEQDPITRPEDEMSWRNAGESKDDILELAGENVSIHEVITVLVNQFIETHDIEVSNA